MVRIIGLGLKLGLLGLKLGLGLLGLRLGLAAPTAIAIVTSSASWPSATWLGLGSASWPSVTWLGLGLGIRFAIGGLCLCVAPRLILSLLVQLPLYPCPCTPTPTLISA